MSRLIDGAMSQRSRSRLFDRVGGPKAIDEELLRALWATLKDVCALLSDARTMQASHAGSALAATESSASTLAQSAAVKVVLQDSNRP